MNARDMMKKEVMTTTPDTPAREVARQLVNNHISGMPVVEQDGTVRGIITEADILRVQVPGERFRALKVKDLMSPQTLAIDADAPVDEIRKLLMEYHILRLPVVEKGQLVGIISRSDVIRAMLDVED